MPCLQRGIFCDNWFLSGGVKVGWLFVYDSTRSMPSLLRFLVILRFQNIICLSNLEQNRAYIYCSDISFWFYRGHWKPLDFSFNITKILADLVIFGGNSMFSTIQVVEPGLHHELLDIYHPDLSTSRRRTHSHSRVQWHSEAHHITLIQIWIATF